MNVIEARMYVQQLESELNSIMPSIREANQGLTMFLALRRQMGLHGDIWELLTVLQQVRLSAEMAIRGVYMLYMATGPIGWFIGGLTVLAGLATAMSIRSPRY